MTKTAPTKPLLLLVIAITCSAIVAGVGVAGCGGQSLDESSHLRRNSPTSSDGTTPTEDGTDINTTGQGAGSGANTGLPCDVQQMFENRCVGCHIATPPPLLSYEDLLKPGLNGQTVAARALARMKDAARPMPPAPATPPAADEIATLEAWVNAGTPRAPACTGADGGVPASNPYNTPTVCTSNKTWRGEESAEMDPGGACITCHLRKGPAFTVAGTVYPTAHEPNNCYGVSSATLKVVVTDAQNKIVTLSVNQTGNFRTNERIAAPFRVKVVDGAKERVMVGTLTAGDCNSCHTEKGVNGAPGRVIAP